jgi:hypothetical protein
MTLRDNRSMTHELLRGETDGSLKNLRPNAANAEYAFAQNRAALLNVLHYGNLGVASESSPRISEASAFDGMPSGYGPKRPKRTVRR